MSVPVLNVYSVTYSYKGSYDDQNMQVNVLAYSTDSAIKNAYAVIVNKNLHDVRHFLSKHPKFNGKEMNYVNSEINSSYEDYFDRRGATLDEKHRANPDNIKEYEEFLLSSRLRDETLNRMVTSDDEIIGFLQTMEPYVSLVELNYVRISTDFLLYTLEDLKRRFSSKNAWKIQPIR